MTSPALGKQSAAARERMYILLLAAIQFAHIVDFVVMMPLGPTLMNSLGVSPVQFASLVSSYSFSAALAGVGYGVIADRFDRKRLLITAFLGFIIGTLACGLVASFDLLLLARILAGAFGGVLNGIVFAVVTDLIPYKRRGGALGIIMSAFSVASVLGVPIGLGIADKFGWQKTFWFIALFSIPIFIGSIMVFPPLKEHAQKQNAWENLKRFVKLLGNFSYLRSYLLIALLSLSSFLAIPFLAPFAVKNLGIMETDLKYVYLVGGLATIVTSRLIGKATDRFGALRIFLVLIVWSFIPIYLYTHANPMGLAGYLTLSTLFMTATSGRFIPAMTMVTEIAHPQERGTFMGLLNSVRSLASASATLIAGMIVVEGAGGQLEKFNQVGYLSITFGLVAIFIGLVVHRLLRNKLHDNKLAH